MSGNVQDYLNLITSEHQDKPNFVATVGFNIAPYAQLQACLAQLPNCLNINDTNNCIGVWLDMIGQWVGVSRNLDIPIPGTYFTWGGTDPTVGWGYGSWYAGFSPSAIVTLPDDVYRTLLQTKIAANNWDGTVEGAYAIWSIFFPNLTLLIQDNQNMSMTVGLVGGIVDSLTLALLTGGYIQLKPEGVRVAYYAIPVDTNPLFAWGCSSEYLGGWGVGSWAMEVLPT